VLSVTIFLPLAAALALLGLPRVRDRAVVWAWVAVSSLDLAIVLGMWAGYRRGGGVTGALAYETKVAWIPTVGSSYHVGLDGLSLPLVALTAGLFLACAVYSLRETRRVRALSVRNLQVHRW
jgi:NADH-quinone oxidoreductase subunit M